MPRPRGLTFKNRLAPIGGGFFFYCQRVNHPNDGPMQQTLADTYKRDAEAFVAAHDNAFHNLIYRHIGYRPEEPVFIEELLEEWAQHIAELETQGIRSRKTRRHYELVGQYLSAAFGVRQDLSQLRPRDISRAVKLMRRESTSAGATIVKALSALKTMLRWKGVKADWQIPLDEINPQRQVQRDLTTEQILWILRNAPRGSVEEAAIALKMRTGMREVEIAAANVEDFDPDEQLIEPELRAKRKKKRHVYVLGEDLVRLLIPFTRGKARAAPLLHIDTARWGRRRLGETSLRRRLESTSRRANDALRDLLRSKKISRDEYKRKLIDPPLRGLKPIRAEVATLLIDEKGDKEAAAFLGHESPTTTRRWYYKDRRTAAKLAGKRQMADFLARTLPLPQTAAQDRRRGMISGRAIPGHPRIWT